MIRSTFTRLFTIVLLISLPLWLDSCSKDSDPSSSSPVGSWKFSTITVSPALSGITDLMAFLKAFGDTCYSDVVITFKSDGTVASTNPPSCAANSDDLVSAFNAGKWVVNGNKLTLTESTGLKTDFDYALSGSTMTLSYSEPDVDPTTGKTVTYTYTIKMARQ